MTWLIGQIIARTGLGSLFASILAYALIAVIAGGSLWGYGALKFHAGKSAGVSQERIAWEEQRKRDLAKQAAKVAQDQAKIDQIEAENQALEGRLAETQIALDEAIKTEGADQKPAMSRGVAKALNGVGK